jgi:hypothetical protein
MSEIRDRAQAALVKSRKFRDTVLPASGKKFRSSNVPSSVKAQFSGQNFFSGSAKIPSAHFKNCPATVNLVPLPQKILRFPFKILFFPPTPANTNGPAGRGTEKPRATNSNLPFLTCRGYFAVLTRSPTT